ncbi:Cof-type HAD-IIB family hydrolase [Streptococcus thoraltensis]|uniref:Cof-type HAD-IIB family hydrolase n=1 Tax=Streptococcus thoraltensis TaxID=55085 RepID=UPI001F598D8A|nr:Cof-type HAD-IIB family hydrolase [Streptococcus thoraltensis]
MTKKIIAIDLDGTLLHNDNTISDYTVNTIQKVRQQGHQVVIATGRPYRMALDHYKRLKLDTPIITFNGSLTHLPGKKWEYEQSITLDRQYLFEILKASDLYEMDFIASEYRKNFYITLNYPERITPSLFGVDKITEQMRLDPAKITRDPNALLMQTRAADKMALADTIREHLKNEIEVDSWGGPLNILEASPKGINKAFALSHLLSIFNKTRDDLIAFGDEHNDTEMLHFAKKGYAMKNASQVLLPHADEQLAFTNEEDGVAKQLEKLFL